MPLRKRWALLWAYLLVGAVYGIAPYLRLTAALPTPGPLAALQIAVDGCILLALGGYVVYRPIRPGWLRWLVLALVPVIGLRVLLVLQWVAPLVWPWRGGAEQFVSVAILAGIVPALLSAYALWTYAMNPRNAPPTRPVADGPAA